MESNKKLLKNKKSVCTRVYVCVCPHVMKQFFLQIGRMHAFAAVVCPNTAGFAYGDVYVCVRACDVGGGGGGGKCAEDLCVFFGVYVFLLLQECVNILLFLDHFVPKTSRTLKSFPRHALGVGASEI